MNDSNGVSGINWNKLLSKLELWASIYMRLDYASLAHAARWTWLDVFHNFEAVKRHNATQGGLKNSPGTCS
jgi:hypothetical protein